MSVKKSPKSLNSPPTSTTNSFEQLQLRSSGDMSASAAASAAAIALALDLKPKLPIISDTQQQLHQLQQQAAQLQHPQQHQQQQQQQQQPQHQQQQKIKKLVRRNASDKLKLIQMVHDNPILWDSRLPNFKGAEEEKNRAWEQIGKEFNAPGRRVARAFKSLRESYRRELAHVKLMGNNFKPKWSLYDAMDFLRDVIRERKGGSHAAEPVGINFYALAQQMKVNTNNNNNNNNNNNTNNNNNNNPIALNLSKCSSTHNQTSSAEDYYNYCVKPELDLSNQNTNPNANTVNLNGMGMGGGGVTTPVVNIPPAHQNNTQNNDSRVSSTRNDTSNINNTYDDMDNSSMRSGEDENSSVRNTAPSQQGSDEVEELEAIDADFPYPLILSTNSPSTSNNGPPNKRRHKHLHSTGEEDEDDEEDDDYEGQMLQQHRHLRAQQNSVGLLNGLNDMMPPPQTVREVLNSKFCGFISAKLNSMEDTEADNLMNKILMLLVQPQTQPTTTVLMTNYSSDCK